MFSVHPVCSVNAVRVFRRFLLYLGSAVLTDGQASTSLKPKNIKKISTGLAFFQGRSLLYLLRARCNISVLTNNVLQTSAGFLCA